MATKTERKQLNSVLICGLTPSLLEKPAVWFAKNRKKITRARLTSAWWRKNTAVLSVGDTVKIAGFARTLADLGYEKINFSSDAGSQPKLFRGTFKILGSTVQIWPCNTPTAISIDWIGNAIQEITEMSLLAVPTYLSDVRRPIKQESLPFCIGDYVVHQDHGIGIFKGLKEADEKYLILGYAPARIGGDPDTLLVPISQKQKVSQYIGFRTPQVHRLGTPLWQNTRRRAKEDLIKFARELLAVYKNRDKQARPPYHADHMEKAVWSDFPHEETASQKNAIEEIFRDMSRPEPMDRILLGDVGFGKTEIALRAALRAAANGRQAAILAPTTVLCEQHFNVFAERLKNTPLNIAKLSRLETGRAAKKTAEQVKNSLVDILIATHKMISKSLEFNNLGLLIIDEEQRFGVRQKESLKSRYPTVDILSLSATPIPRTMHMCLSKIRSLSILGDAPHGKQPPQTFILPFNKKLIREAALQEIKNGGRVYYLANRIHRIPQTVEFLQEILPKARIGVLHGRLGERDIAGVMKNFRGGKIDILVSTTIIENGLDISEANTLIVEDASLLGLAEAHQIRGRIGRGNRPSWAYFFFSRRLKPKASERLETLERFQHLGAGMEIARRDLELRGAGNILGPEQSGAINRVGWNLYFQLLGESLEELQRLE